jgi:hypothetical protein
MEVFIFDRLLWREDQPREVEGMTFGGSTLPKIVHQKGGKKESHSMTSEVLWITFYANEVQRMEDIAKLGSMNWKFE